MKWLHLFNSNVYLTNLLLLPCIIFSILIYRNALTWSDSVDVTKVKSYSYMWLVITIILIISVCLSNIHHFFMFGRNKFWNKIGDIDSKISAPLLGLLVVVMNIIYIYYIKSPCQQKNSHINILVIQSILFH